MSPLTTQFALIDYKFTAVRVTRSRSENVVEIGLIIFYGVVAKDRVN